MRENFTEIVFILDASGSMVSLTNDTIGGYNAFIEKQKKEPGEASLTTITFNDTVRVLHNSVNIKEAKPLTKLDYVASGFTALLDAVGSTINSIGHKLYCAPEDQRPSKVIFVITTDGQENASKEFSYEKVKGMITHQHDVYNWEFIFLGANIDAIQVASSIGIMNASNYTANSFGTQSLYNAVNSTVSTYRSSGVIEKDWNKEVE